MFKLNDYVVSPSFHHVDRIIVSRNYPPNALLPEEFIRVMQLLYRTDKGGKTFAGRKEYSKYQTINRAKFKQMDTRLQELGIITQEGYRGKSKTPIYTVNMLPVFDIAFQRTYSFKKAHRTKVEYKRAEFPFIIFPSTLENYILSNVLNTREKKVLMKLYRYNSLQHFGGIDNDIYREESGVTIISPRLYNDLYLTRDEFKVILDKLITIGLIRKVDVLVNTIKYDFQTIYKFICDFDHDIPPKEGIKMIGILRPVHLPKTEINNLEGVLRNVAA